MELSNDLITIFIPNWLLVFGAFVAAFVITYFSIPPIIYLARSKGFYDLPNGRTSHINATPYLGGVAVFTGLILSTVIIAGLSFGKELAFIIAGLIILLFVGLKDDMLTINPIKKIAGQLISSGIIVILGDIRIDNFYGCLGFGEISYLASILFSIFVFLVVINGINLIDGIDGLASGIGIIISLFLGTWFVLIDSIPYAVMSFSLCGSLIAFFYFNVFSKSNKIFLGDAGSLMVGLTISILTIQFLKLQIIADTYAINSAPAVAFSILIVPLFDTLRVFILRISQGRSPFSADRQHIHHILLDIGYSHFQASLILISFNVLFMLLSLTFQNLRNMHLILSQLAFATLLSLLAVNILNGKRRKEYRVTLEGGKQVNLFDNPMVEKYTEKEKSEIKKKKIHIFDILNF